LTNSQQDDQNTLVETSSQTEPANNSNSTLDVYFSARLSLLGLISLAGLASFYYYHNDLVVTGITASISALTLLPLPSIIKATFDFFRNKKTVEAEKDKKLLDMTIQNEVTKQQASFGDNLNEVLTVTRTVQASFDFLRLEIASVNLNVDAKFNENNSRLNDLEFKLIDMQRQMNAGFTETHNDIRRLEQQTNDQISAIRQRLNPQE
jgi:hypothetical protein